MPNQWRFDLQWTGYLYDGQIFGHDADYHEFYAFLHYQDLLTARISAVPDYYGLGGYGLDYAITGRYSITDALQFSASFGYAYMQPVLGSDYPYWNIGCIYGYKFVKLSLFYMDSSETFISKMAEEKHDLYNPAKLDATAVFSISVGF